MSSMGKFKPLKVYDDDNDEDDNQTLTSLDDQNQPPPTPRKSILLSPPSTHYNSRINLSGKLGLISSESNKLERFKLMKTKSVESDTEKMLDFSEKSTPNIGESVTEDDENNGFRTPKSLKHKIPTMLQCPPAPKRPRWNDLSPSPSGSGRRAVCRRVKFDLTEEIIK